MTSICPPVALTTMSDVASAVAVEICVDSVEGALAAQQGGAQRVELCDNLVEGGTTPSSGMIALARQQLTIGLHVIIRPRGGDFLYSALEFAVMQQDLLHAKTLGADGVVIGLLNCDGTVDSQRTAALIALARPLTVTFHRAFDMTRDTTAALETLIELGVDRVLTSGQEQSALTGLPRIADLVQQAGKRIIVMPGGGINEENVGTIIQQSGVCEVHLSARSTTESAMRYRNERVHMGLPDLSEFQRKITDVNRVRAVVAKVAPRHMKNQP
ncbi:MAG: copper homeostasis protein CutC [Caldilineaceae bacterium]|nr:copper homeostasis protein CutC [Caldilineaceae bacterium]